MRYRLGVVSVVFNVPSVRRTIWPRHRSRQPKRGAGRSVPRGRGSGCSDGLVEPEDVLSLQPGLTWVLSTPTGIPASKAQDELVRGSCRPSIEEWGRRVYRTRHWKFCAKRRPPRNSRYSRGAIAPVLDAALVPDDRIGGRGARTTRHPGWGCGSGGVSWVKIKAPVIADRGCQVTCDSDLSGSAIRLKRRTAYCRTTQLVSHEWLFAHGLGFRQIFFFRGD